MRYVSTSEKGENAEMYATKPTHKHIMPLLPLYIRQTTIRSTTDQKSATLNLQRIYPGQRSEPLYMDWCWWILGGLPFPHLVRVMDCYFHEGIKVFYRIALAILILFNKNSSISSAGGQSSSGSTTTASADGSSGNAGGSGGGGTKNGLAAAAAATTSNNKTMMGDWQALAAGDGIGKLDIDNALPMFCRNIPVSPSKLLRTAFSIRALR